MSTLLQQSSKTGNLLMFILGGFIMKVLDVLLVETIDLEGPPKNQCIVVDINFSH